MLQNQQNKNHEDEKACAERVSYWLKKYGCDLQASAHLTNGQVAMRIDIVKLPPEVLKEMKKAEKEGRNAGPAFTEEGA